MTHSNRNSKPDSDHDQEVELSPAVLKALSALRQDCTPPHDLWARIEARLPAPTRSDDCEDGSELSPTLAIALSKLRNEQPPTQDLWSGVQNRIDTRIRARRRRQFRAPWIAFAAVAASLVLVVGLVARQEPQPDQGLDGGADVSRQVAGNDKSHKAPLRPSAEVLAATLGNGSEASRDGELHTAAYRPISSETRALVRANLKIVTTAETQIQRALDQDPADATYLHSLLESAQQQKVELSAALAER